MIQNNEQLQKPANCETKVKPLPVSPREQASATVNPLPEKAEPFIAPFCSETKSR